MATTDDNKLRSLAGILGVSSLALLGVTACDDGGTADEPADDGAVEDGGAEDGSDDGMDDGAEDGGMEDEGDDEGL